MKILSILLITFVTLIVLLSVGCTKDVISSTDNCNETDIVNYDDVRQILTGSCGASSNGCHTPGGQTPDYTNWNPGMEASLTMQRFESQVLINGSMPKQGWPQLDSTELKLIKCWVDGGYQK